MNWRQDDQKYLMYDSSIQESRQLGIAEHTESSGLGCA